MRMRRHVPAEKKKGEKCAFTLFALVPVIVGSVCGFSPARQTSGTADLATIIVFDSAE